MARKSLATNTYLFSTLKLFVSNLLISLILSKYILLSFLHKNFLRLYLFFYIIYNL